MSVTSEQLRQSMTVEERRALMAELEATFDPLDDATEGVRDIAAQAKAAWGAVEDAADLVISAAPGAEKKAAREQLLRAYQMLFEPLGVNHLRVISGPGGLSGKAQISRKYFKVEVATDAELRLIEQHEAKYKRD